MNRIGKYKSLGHRERYFFLLIIVILIPVSSLSQDGVDANFNMVSEPSNTIPVMYINTDHGKAITSKTEYVSATFYIADPAGQASIGSLEAPQTMQIRGRGHSSWRGDKKPYKIKLDNKLPLLGMPKNKHWALLKFNPPTMAGFKLGNLIGMDWTPSCKPIEVVLNGDYIGLYLLTETIRIGKDRVNIYEQPDRNVDASTIPGGWLVEVDNYFESNQIMFRENPQWNINITYHSPEVLSEAQKNWLTDEFKGINQDIYSKDKNHSKWEERIDVDAMARFFIIQEVLNNPDGFHSSFYLHKDLGEGQRWVAGPIWDLSCMKREKTDYTYKMKVSYVFTPHWIDELLKDDDFCTAVRQAWKEFYPAKSDKWIDDLVNDFYPYESAYTHDCERWHKSVSRPLSEEATTLRFALKRNMEWFNLHLPGHETSDINFAKQNGKSYTVYSLQGIKIRETSSYHDATHGLPKGIYILNGKKIFLP